MECFVHFPRCLLPHQQNQRRRWQQPRAKLNRLRKCTDDLVRVRPSGVHESLSLGETDVFQVALLVDCGGRSARKASLLVKRASISACIATTSGQCGGAVASRGGRRRSTSSRSSSERSLRRRLLKLNNRPVRPRRLVFAIPCRHLQNSSQIRSRRRARLQLAHHSPLDTTLRRSLQMATSACRLRHSHWLRILNIQCSRHTKSTSKRSARSLSTTSQREETRQCRLSALSSRRRKPMACPVIQQTVGYSRSTTITSRRPSTRSRSISTSLTFRTAQ